MANSLLTSTKVTREALRILHQKLNFIGNCNRQYDDEFGNRDGKIGQSLLVRLPNKYTAATGRVITAQDTTNRSVTLPVATQFNVPMSFTSAELGMSLEKFSENVLEPAMAVMAAKIEGDMLADVVPLIHNAVGIATAGGSPVNSLATVLGARKYLNDNLTPMDRNRSVILNTQHSLDLTDSLKGLFQDSSAIAQQYKEGKMGRTGGFDFYENTLLPRQTPGVLTGTPTVSGAGQGITTGYAATTSLLTTAWTASTANIIRKGDVINLAGVYEVHPETKAALPYLKRYVATADATSAGAGATTIIVSPAIITGGPYQNCSASPANGALITQPLAPTTITPFGQSLAFHKDAFIFATGKLKMPKGVDFAGQEEYDGISMRIVSDYDVTNDLFITRVDVLAGWITAYPELACRIVGN